VVNVTAALTATSVYCTRQHLLTAASALHWRQQVAVEGTNELLRRVVRVDLSAAFPAEPPALSASEVLTGQAWQFDSHGLKYRLASIAYASIEPLDTKLKL
jgi:hypothetical protein